MVLGRESFSYPSEVEIRSFALPSTDGEISAVLSEKFISTRTDGLLRLVLKYPKTHSLFEPQSIHFMPSSR